MKREFIAWLAVLTVAHGAPDLDLTPRYMTTSIDGPPIRRPYFVVGGNRFGVTLDPETELSAYEDSALFTFTKFRSAAMRLRESPLKTSIPFDEGHLSGYREAVLLLLPAAAINPAIELEETNVLPINDWRSQRFTLVYEFGGQEMRESVTFLNLNPHQQVVLQIRACRSDFTNVTARGLDIIRRWYAIRPEGPKPGN